MDNNKLETIYASFGKIYDFAFYVDLNTLEVYFIKLKRLKAVAEISHIKNYYELVDTVCKTSIADGSVEGFREFHDLATLSQRLGGRECIFYEYESRDGRWVRLYLVVASYDEFGKPEVITLSGRDITDIKRVEITTKKNMIDAMDRANEANEAKTEFLSRLSHDIRTPMNSIMGFSELIMREPDNSKKVADYIGKIRFSGQQLLSMISDVLDMSKIESGRMDVNLHETRLSDMLFSQLSMLFPRAHEKGLETHVYTRKLDTDFFLMDDVRLSQVISNLWENAIKYTDKGDITIEVISHKSDLTDMRQLEFIISDTGIGMSEEFMAKMFRPFERERREGHESIGGTGLGLAIAKSLTEMMGGTIMAESFMYEGSTFTVKIPVKVCDKGSDAASFEKNGIRRMIVADNDNRVSRNVTEMMEELGVSADIARDADELLGMMVKGEKSGEPYDLVLVDRTIPGRENIYGDRMKAKLEELTLPIIVVTSEDTSLTAEQYDSARELNVNAVLPKPFIPQKLLGLVESLNKDSSDSPNEMKDFVYNDVGNGYNYSLEGLNILAAEDNPLSAELLKEIITSEGAGIFVASDGLVALDKYLTAAEGEYDLVLMDIQMPVMDGLETTRRIRAAGRSDSRSVPIIALSANAFYEDVQAALDAGMDAHIKKPLDIPELKRTISRLIGKDNK